MAYIQSYEDLEIWQLGMDLLVDVYSLTGTLPDSERYNLASQLKRAVVSVPCNIAEGWGRGLGASQAYFVRVARGSAYEVKTLLHAIERVGLDLNSATPALRDRVDVLARKLNAYLSQLERNLTREERAEYDSMWKAEQSSD